MTFRHLKMYCRETLKTNMFSFMYHKSNIVSYSTHFMIVGIACEMERNRKLVR